MKILMTNDDSHRSPLLQLAVDIFTKLGEVDLVVPLHEQSWMGKSMSRFNPIHVREELICGRSALSLSGTPADCVNFGVYSRGEKKPDLVVSGINAGYNIGLGFILSSGTVGACFEGNLAGVPGIAISQAFDTETRNIYANDYLISAAQMELFTAQTEKVLSLFLEKALSNENREVFLKTPVTWNINLPFSLTSEKTLSLCPMSTTRYAQCFNEIESSESREVVRYKHGPLVKLLDEHSAGDSSVVRSGGASVSVLDIWQLTKNEVRPEIEFLARSFERSL